MRKIEFFYGKTKGTLNNIINILGHRSTLLRVNTLLWKFQVYSRGVQIFKKSRNHCNIQGARKVS
jgi:hypothetical protein